MGIDKLHIGIVKLQEVGNMLDDGLEAARKELIKAEAIGPAMDQVSNLIEQLCKAVENDIDSGDIPVTKEPLEIAAYAKKYILQAKKLVDDSKARASKGMLICQGQVTAMERSVKNVKKLYDSDIAKVEALRVAIESGDEGFAMGVGSRAVGQHPGPSLKERRQVEEVKEELEKEKGEKGDKGALNESVNDGKKKKDAGVGKDKKAPTKRRRRRKKDNA